MNTRAFVFLILASLAVMAAPLASWAGNEGPHGGDTYSLEFTTIGASLADRLEKLEQQDNRLFRKWNFTADEFRRAVLGSRDLPPVRVISKERVYLKDQEVEATNELAKNLITLSRSSWREAQLHERVRLTMHEYFGILGVEQDRYDASIDFADFTLATTQDIAKKSESGEFMANIFYGYVRSYPALSEIQSCDPQSNRIKSAIEIATQLAMNHCAISQDKSCELIGTTLNEVVSTEIIGMKYCEVLVMMK